MKTWKLGLILGPAWLVVLGCGSYNPGTDGSNHRQGSASSAASAAGASGDSTGVTPRLAQASTDQVLGTLVVPFGQSSASLLDAQNNVVHWTVDMQDSEVVAGGVAPDKYLKVKGDLKVPASADNKEYDIGCIFVDLKDNVYYRERTWLRLATTGIKGKTYTEVSLPLTVDDGGWQPVPDLDGSLTLQEFTGNSIKKFDGTLCFKLDFSNAPAQQYEGDLVVQYLRPGGSTNPPACSEANKDAAECRPKATCEDPPSPTPSMPATPATPSTPAVPPAVFACGTQPMVLKAKQQTTLSWTGVPAGSQLQVKLAADTATYSGAVGTVQVTGNSAVYTAPDTVPTTVRIAATAQPVGTEQLPTFCQINLTADDQLGIADDGEVQGLPGNVYALPVNTAKLPDLGTLTPIDHIVASNLDVPNRYFSTGFPGVKNLFEWFAIRFSGQLLVPQNATCSFKLSSDDGAILYLDGNAVVNNDGLHPVTDKTGTATLSKGSHAFRVDYYQGPRWYIALQVFWKCGTDADYTIVPPAAFTRPLQ